MRITNAHQNNLKNISLELPDNKLIVVTGLSGSGKSSLAMDIIGNEGYRYFLESLPSYNQQNALSIPTAEVDGITGLPPVIRVEQSKRFRSVNATFGTLSELAVVFRILFARYSTSETLSKSLFSFNHPKGACERCYGIGNEEYIDLDKLIEDENRTLREGAITTTLPNGYIVYSQVTVEELDKVCRAHDFRVDIPWRELSSDQKNVILNGSDRIKVFYGKHSIESRLKWKGLKAKPREKGFYKGMLPIMNDILKRDRNQNILKFVSSRTCPSCKGARIKTEHLAFEWQKLNFQQWMELPLDELYNSLNKLSLSAGEEALVKKICTPLQDLIQLGMKDYRLSTPSDEISSGDAQRIKLVSQVNSDLQGILYIFDEPSIGLPEAYQGHLRQIFQRLISRRNTVMVVEHDLNFIRSADWILELGPGAGVHGGEVIFNGPVHDFLQSQGISSATLEEMQKSVADTTPELTPISAVSFEPEPGALTVISRKTADIEKKLATYTVQNGMKLLQVSDQPIGKTPRSNPATYTGLADKIRDLLAKTEEAKKAKLAKGAFSFNNKSGRCPACEGAGVITLAMNVMGTINQVCPTCNGKRFKPEVLQVVWNDKNIAEIYDLSILQASDFFREEKQVIKILSLMIKLGLGYIKLGQPSNTLSGGEAQRIKLTKHFARQSKTTLLVLEEPSIGLHQRNVRQLLDALHKLKKRTGGIICFENHDLFKTHSDVWVDNAIESKEYRQQESLRKPGEGLSLTGVRTHHLKDLNLNLPKERLTVVTGISGSGKSSLLIDTLHGFGLQEMTKQFSSYQQSRTGVNFQFEADRIEGLTPTICITRKERSFTERSDIAKQTGIDRVLRFAFSRKAQYEGTELSASHFSNSHELGKCPVCDGLGREMQPDMDKIVLNGEKSISTGLFDHNKALAYYGHPGSQFMAIVKELGKTHGFDLETPFEKLNSHQKELLFHGTGDTVWETSWHFKTKTREGAQELRMPWKGIFGYLQDEYFKTRKNKNIEKLVALFSPEQCSHCQGSGLKPERLNHQIGGKSIHQLRSMPFKDLETWLAMTDFQEEVDRELTTHMKPLLVNTIKRAKQLHIDHLHLNRKSATLSGGENQRVSLIKQLNSPLKGITYILDEPSAGLSHDNIPDLIAILKELIEKGNTVLVIEHNKEIIHSADHLVELGPGAGSDGGYITYQGTPRNFVEQEDCHPYLKTPSNPVRFKKGKESIKISKLARYTLVKDVLEVPVGGITAISGKSGAGKTTLVRDIIIPSIQTRGAVHCEKISFPRDYTKARYFEPKKLRTHSGTLLADYLDLLKRIGKIFAGETGLKARDFSYKTKSSQCPECKGRGYVETSLDVVANSIETCEKCHGRRYRTELLQYKIASKNIAEVLSLDIAELMGWLEEAGVAPASESILEELTTIGLEHLNLDQPVRSLSSGEKQRLLLLNWLQHIDEGALYILDEPGTGLHYADIDLLFGILQKLSRDNDILVIDHNRYLLEKIGVGMILE
ncbi:ATP-binding cassette domain-containing protein [Robertkochia aurantiaca]|uniref:ATP-binding cassette domain-containing protein n=1 Tax=Robertkochia aurantiaca TaxID=2873700 RepID=UPI001CCB04E9|nr:ATP-binding cassette domain-containing protein [Robertkochia sp. 3YJGBD-33]